MGIPPGVSVDEAMFKTIYVLINESTEEVGIKDIPVLFLRAGPLVYHSENSIGAIQGGNPEVECEFTRKFRELIPGHEITVTVRDGGYIQRVVVGRLPQTEKKEEEVRKKVEVFYAEYWDHFFANIGRGRRFFDRYRVLMIGGIGGPPYFPVGIEENWMCPFRIAELFYRFQEVSKVVGVGVIGRDIPIVFYKTTPTELLSRAELRLSQS